MYIPEKKLGKGGFGQVWLGRKATASGAKSASKPTTNAALADQSQVREGPGKLPCLFRLLSILRPCSFVHVSMFDENLLKIQADRAQIRAHNKQRMHARPTLRMECVPVRFICFSTLDLDFYCLGIVFENVMPSSVHAGSWESHTASPKCISRASRMTSMSW